MHWYYRKDLVSKKSGLGNSCCSTSSTTSLETSSSVSVTTSNDSSASCSPSGSASSLKSSSNSRRKADSRKSRLAASSSTSKTPLRCLLGDKIVLENPGLSTPSLSMSNHSSNDPAKSTRNFKPSGLRMPSPKIGFFDEDAEKNGEANSFPHKSPKILSRMNMASAGQRKKISLGADHAKMGNKVATLGSGKDFILSKKSGLGNSCSTSSTTSLESSSSVSVTTSSASLLKSSSNSRRKEDSRKSSLAASGSTSKTPLRCSLGDKIVLENPGLSTPSLSMSNHSPYESPVSSIDGWSSESSSTANQSSNCLEVSFHTSTSRGACLGNDATQALNFQSFPHHECFNDQESHQTRFPDPCLEVVTGTANDLAKSTRNFKPSGLRMPSPRIGFFDESALPNISGVTNRKRPDKLQTTRILLENGDTKLGSVQNGVMNPSLNAIRRYAAHNQELDKNSPKMSSTSATSRNLPGKTSKALKKLDDIARNRVKSTPISRRQSIYMQGSKRVKEDVEKNGESNSFPHKSPKILGRMNMVLAGQRKKISLGADQVKMGNKVATLGSGKDLIVSKKSCSTGSTTSLKSSYSVSVTTSNDSSASCSPSGSASSLKSSSNSRRKVDSRKSRLAASGSTSKTPLRCSLGDKLVLENPCLSTPSLSMSNHSSNDPAKSTKNFKPSGLRMPSPKIGFFDEILGRMNMVSTGQRKKISLGADHVKMGNKGATLGSGKDLIVSKKSGLGNSCCSTSSTTSLESSSSVSVTTSNDSSVSCSPSGSASSLKSSSNLRRKADSRKSRLAASGSTSKTPLSCSLGDKIVLENPESSPTANQNSNCLEVNFYASTSRGACLGNDATQALNFQSFPHDECFDDQESHQRRFPNLCLEVVRGTANDLAKSTRNFKPSGLRMPSPRIGFFDEDKAMMSTVGGDFLFHFGAQSALPNISGVTNRKRLDKLQTTRILLENGDTKLGSVQFR
ncbi:hypothetical protein LOK49_LG12G01283 [Camellia lanceoleosa]|uniref:Uncharacterized protein n=1 Tax=Camellia lanceoleosa TaxID=1840588 RepID=A0ACC0FUJ3_9ERIC|nr:hypothetical protein LOK49_LG12G01283 [Camellia lanceoleosa]